MEDFLVGAATHLNRLGHQKISIGHPIHAVIVNFLVANALTTDIYFKLDGLSKLLFLS